jgi:hypothetical protein
MVQHHSWVWAWRPSKKAETSQWTPDSAIEEGVPHAWRVWLHTALLIDDKAPAFQSSQNQKEDVLVCRQWQYEHVAPTAQKPINHPKKWPKGHKHERLAAERQQSIAKNMASMDKWIAEAKVLASASLPF